MPMEAREGIMIKRGPFSQSAPPVPPDRSTAWGVGGTDWAVGGALRGAEGAEVENRPSRGPF